MLAKLTLLTRSSLVLCFLSAMFASSACSSGVAGGLRGTADYSVDGPYSVETLEFPRLRDASRDRRVPIKVHYPVGDGAMPLIVISHGAGGHWDANYAQAHHLASHGYVVLALEHIGSNLNTFRSALRGEGKNMKQMTRDANEVLGRPKDLSFAIDQAERWNRAHRTLRGRIDLERVGVTGHSFGAYTTLVATGMRPALDWLTPTVAPGRGLAGDLSDPRIDCGVALSPQGPGEPFFTPESYAYLRTPMLGISGSKDMQQESTPQNRRRAYELWPPGDKYFIWLTNARHMAFSDSTGSGRRMPAARQRESVQPVVRASMLLFFNQYLKAGQPGAELLTEAALQPYLKGPVNRVEVLRK